MTQNYPISFLSGAGGVVLYHGVFRYVRIGAEVFVRADALALWFDWRIL